MPFKQTHHVALCRDAVFARQLNGHPLPTLQRARVVAHRITWEAAAVPTRGEDVGY
jgi:hypothetical protein